jgi:hypothetical protein
LNNIISLGWFSKSHFLNGKESLDNVIVPLMWSLIILHKVIRLSWQQLYITICRAWRSRRKGFLLMVEMATDFSSCSMYLSVATTRSNAMQSMSPAWKCGMCNFYNNRILDLNDFHVNYVDNNMNSDLAWIQQKTKCGTFITIKELLNNKVPQLVLRQ